MTRRNIERIQQELDGSLEALQLMDHDIKMRIRCVCFLETSLFFAFE
jgi:hypothetical protein